MRKEVNLQQGSGDWLVWRRERVTASNVPVILLESDFQTPYELWCGYVHQPVESAPPTYAMQRGHALEGVVRDEFCLHVGREYYPVCFENSAHPYLGASLDGWCPVTETVLEIKVPSKEKHALAMNGEVPRTYMGQLQAQLLVTGAKYADYVSYDPSAKSWAKVTVYPDQAYFERIIQASKQFMELVVAKTPPLKTDKDFVEVEDEALKQLFISFSETKAKADEYATLLDDIKAKIKTTMNHPRMRFGQIKAAFQERKGSIDYSRVRELRGVDLEPYRKPSTEYLDIRFSSKS